MFILVNKNGVCINGSPYKTLTEATKAAFTCVDQLHYTEVFVCTTIRRVSLPPKDIIIEDLLLT